MIECRGRFVAIQGVNGVVAGPRSLDAATPSDPRFGVVDVIASFATTLLASLLAATPATLVTPPAARGETVRTPLQLDGEVEARARVEFDAQLAAGLGRSGLSTPILDAGCEDLRCWSAAAAQVNAAYLIWPRVTATGRDYDVVVELVEVATASVVATTEQTCEVCGVQEAAEVLASASASLAAKLANMDQGPPMVAVQVAPAGALIEIDGELVGRAPVEREVEPGAHWISASLEGYVSQKREIQSTRGVRESVSLRLSPVPVLGPTKMEIAGWSLVGVGAAGLATGVVLAVLEERPNRVQCSGEDIDPDGDCRLRYATLEAGIGTLAVGGALFVTGLTLALVGRKKRKRSNTSVAVTPRSIAVHGRF